MKQYGKEFLFQWRLQETLQTFAAESYRLNEELEIKALSETSKYDVFLSHSSKDKTTVIGFRRELLKQGFTVYVDWVEDSDAGREKITGKLKTAMRNSKSCIYLHSHNSRNSKWTPWELGFFDNDKGPEKVGVVPLKDNSGQLPSYVGQEYLDQYTQIGMEVLDRFIRTGIQ